MVSFLEERVLPLTPTWQHDFAVDLMEQKDGRCQVVEFNPYWTSSPCLYGDWKNIGKPFIIEDDLYHAGPSTKEGIDQTAALFNRMMSKKNGR